MTIGRSCLALVLAAASMTAQPASAQDRAVQLAIDADGDVRMMTEFIVDKPSAQHVEEPLAAGSVVSDISAIDLATGRPLGSRVERGVIGISLGRPLPARAEQRIALHQRVARRALIADDDTGFRLSVALPPGRVAVLLPQGYTVDECSIDAQYAIDGGRVKVGLVTAGEAIRLRLHAAKGPVNAAAGPKATFRAEDDRSIVYWLDDPAVHRIKLALELLITNPGQAHVYSVLRKQDHISDPISLDVDRGVELRTRVISGKEANEIGDSPTEFAPDAAVLVGDLGYAVPPGGSARVRLYQTATDPEGYRRDENGILVWNRFLARLRTRAVLPSGWSLAASSQPAQVTRDQDGRIVLDFVQTGSDSPPLVVTAVPSDRAIK